MLGVGRIDHGVLRVWTVFRNRAHTPGPAHGLQQALLSSVLPDHFLDATQSPRNINLQLKFAKNLLSRIERAATYRIIKSSKICSFPNPPLILPT